MKKERLYIFGGIGLFAAIVGWVMYNRRWIKFSDNGWTGVIMGNHNHKLSGMVGFVMADSHHFKVGDRVEVEQITGATNSYYNGEATVVYVKDSFVAIDKTFGNSTQPEGGRIRKISW